MRNENVAIRMAESGDPTGSPGDENAMVERMLRTLKEDFRLGVFLSYSAASTSVERAIHACNNLRSTPQLAISFPTRRIDDQSTLLATSLCRRWLRLLLFFHVTADAFFQQPVGQTVARATPAIHIGKENQFNLIQCIFLSERGLKP
ncbi:hypothetical protein [Dyadobacter sp. BHUBP1]|uniref:hypothetical protein n=1 Tax=Dyadobacter sp. BHUBP1 TaxID=3424178 RepID=UPI003D32C70D